MNTLCPCGSGRSGEDCCLAIIRGDVAAETAEHLMRSRYTAYTLSDEHWLRQSWHPSTCPLVLGLDSGVVWQGLTIVQTRAGGSDDATGEVTFIAEYDDQGQRRRMQENSLFVRLDGRWVYKAPVSPMTSAPKVSRNAPCPCGSGKKFKRCCA